MNKLEDLVPPLELCQQIPEGEFLDSALVWVWDLDGDPGLFPRECGICNQYGTEIAIAPASTLAEILEELPTIQYSTEGTDFYLTLCDYRNRYAGWGIGYGRMSHGAFKGLANARERDNDPTTAALRLWFDVKGRG